MRRVLATAGHVDHGKSTLVRALTGRDPDRLAEEHDRGLTIELGFAWTTLPSGADIAFVDVPGHQRFVGTTLAGLGPSPAVVFVVAADQGWQAQSSEHLAAIRALGISDGLLVLTRCDLTDDARVHAVRGEALSRLSAAGLTARACTVSALTGEGIDDLTTALDDLIARLPAPDPEGPVRLWLDRAFTITGAGTVVTGTLGAGTLHTGDTLTLLSGADPREVTVRGLHSQDRPEQEVGPVSRVAVNLRRLDVDAVARGAVLVSPQAFALGRVLDVALEPVAAVPGRPQATSAGRERLRLPEQAMLHVGTASHSVHVRPLGTRHARLAVDALLPWQVGDRAILRDPGDRSLWSARVVDVEPLPLRRRGAARARAGALEAGRPLADLRVASRMAEHSDVLARLGLPDPVEGVRVGRWWADPEALATWSTRLDSHVRDHQARRALSGGVPVAEAVHALDLPAHLADLGPDLLEPLVSSLGLTSAGGRVGLPETASDLGAAEQAVSTVEKRLASTPFTPPDRDELHALGLGPTELAAAARVGRLFRLPGEVVLLPDGPARAMRVLADLDQPFTLSDARQALGTTRRVAVPLLEHLDARGWTRRVDGQLREVVR